MRTHLSLAVVAALFLGSTAAHAVTVTQTFGVGTTSGASPSTVGFTLAGLDPNVESDLAIDFTFFGDLSAPLPFNISSPLQNFELFLDGTSYGVGCDWNTGNGDFGQAGTIFGIFPVLDDCAAANSGLMDATLLVSAVEALGLLADGALDVVFQLSGLVNTPVSPSATETRNGVTFSDTLSATFGVGGTVSYEATDVPAPVPVPPALPMLAAGLAGLGLIRRHKPA